MSTLAQRTEDRIRVDGGHLRALGANVIECARNETMIDANWRFHREVHKTARSQRLIAQISQAVRVVPSNFFTVFPDHKEHSLDDHEELLAALADRDAERARIIAKRHVLDAGRSLADWVDRSGSPTPGT